MKKLVEIVLITSLLCATILCFAYFTDVFKTFLPNQTISLPTSVSSQQKTDITNALMLEVNAINNILTWGSFIIAALTVVAAVFGIAGFVQIKSTIDNKLKSYSSIFEEANELVTNVNNIQKSLQSQQLYIEESNKALYKSVYAIASQINDEKVATNLMKQQLHSTHVLTLYRPSMDSEDRITVKKKKEGALLYFRSNGTKKDIPILEYVAKNDVDPNIKKIAQEIIIRIKLNKNSKNNNHLYRFKNWWNFFKFVFKD